jgi:AbrB family looped-hinge helix DNA binding protein
VAFLPKGGGHFVEVVDTPPVGHQVTVGQGGDRIHGSVFAPSGSPVLGDTIGAVCPRLAEEHHASYYRLTMKTRLSSKGQLVLPKVLRERYGLKEGTEVELEEVEGGVLLHFVPATGVASLDDLLGCVGYHGPRRSLVAMQRAIARGARASARHR